MRVYLGLSVFALSAALVASPVAAIDLGGVSVDIGGAVTVSVPAVTGALSTPAVTVNTDVSTPGAVTVSTSNSIETSSGPAGGDADSATPQADNETGANDASASGDASLSVIGDLFGSTTGLQARTASANEGSISSKRRAAPQAVSKCFSPNAAQIDHLLSRATYSPDMAAAWRQARVTVTPVNICADARSQVAAAISADANMAVLKSMIADTRKVRRSLSRAGNDAGDVLAVDSRSGTVTVFVF